MIAGSNLYESKDKVTYFQSWLNIVVCCLFVITDLHADKQILFSGKGLGTIIQFNTNSVTVLTLILKSYAILTKSEKWKQ